jgi:hypothetical protein
MSGPKDERSPRSSLGKWFQVMKECESIEVMNSVKKQTGQGSKLCSRIRMLDSKERGNPRNTISEFRESMEECESLEIMNNLKVGIR